MASPYTIVHSLPGRIRLRFAESPEPLRALAKNLLDFEQRHSGVRQVRWNAWCRSAVIAFDPSCISTDALLQEIARCCEILHGTAAQTREHEITSLPGSGPRRVKEAFRTVAEKLASLRAAVPRPKTAMVKWSRPPPRTEQEPAAAVTEGDASDWHLIDADVAAHRLKADAAQGIPGEEALRRLVRYGPNALEPASQRSLAQILLEQFLSLPVGLLISSAAISVATGGMADAVVILGVVCMNAGLGFATETHAEKTIASLAGPRELPATVVRNGRSQVVSAAEIVPGDLLVLTPGSQVAADARLIRSERLTIDESALTGESVPVEKNSRRLTGEHVPLRQRVNMAYRGTLVTGGSGRGFVVATADTTEVGKIQRMVGHARPPETPLQRQLAELGTTLAFVCGGVCAGVFGIGTLRGYGTLAMLKTASSLAVAAVPEGLPMIATTTLALGVRRMRSLNVAVRRLPAIETLGSVQVFCLDKTGTVTLNRMTVTDLFAGRRGYRFGMEGLTHHDEPVTLAAGHELSRLMVVCVLCSEADVDLSTPGRPQWKGSPTETSLLDLAVRCGLDIEDLRAGRPLLHTEHRTETRRFMATLHQDHERGRFLAVKGRPSDVLNRCQHVIEDGEKRPLTDDVRQEIETANARLAGQGLRLLGCAYAVGDLDDSADAELTWLGLVGIADPIRQGMQDVIAEFHRAGIRTVMITGDQSATAQAIARELNISGGDRLEMLDSAKLEGLSRDVLRSLAQRVHVFSAVSPSQKLQIVTALQEAGLVVAMTGDGINDGPSLKAADIGVAMGRGGSDVARMVADVVLEDDQLETMITAIRQGRAIYANTRRAIRYLLATNLSEILVMFTSVASGAGTPLTALQLLWLNAVSDIFPVLALALQAPDSDILDRPPRDPQEPFLPPQAWRDIGMQSAVMSAGCLAAFAWGKSRYGLGPRARTIAFTSLTLAQLWHILDARSETRGLFSRQPPARNPFLPYALAGCLGLQFLGLTVPRLRRLLGCAPLSVADWLVALLGAGGPYLANEALKAFLQRPAFPTVSAPLTHASGDGEPR